MKRFRWALALIILILPFMLVACGEDNQPTMATPSGLTVESGGLIIFERVADEGYYVISIDDSLINVFANSPNVSLYNEDGVDYLQYDASKIFILGENYAVKVKACADGMRDSAFTSTVSYSHTIPMIKPSNIQINGTTITWDAVENASQYYVKVMTPSDDIAQDDSESIANADLPVYQRSTNTFDFSSLLNEAGEYKFYINAVSNNSLFSESGYTSKTVYKHIVTLSAPENAKIFKVSDSQSSATLHLVAVVDENANGITVRMGDVVKTAELNGTEVSVSLTDNIVDIDLNALFGTAFDEYRQYSFSMQANYFTSSESYYINSTFTPTIVYDNFYRLTAPNVSLIDAVDGYRIEWSVNTSERANVSGYVVSVLGESELIHEYELNSASTSMTLPSDCVSAYVRALGSGNYLDSQISEIVSVHDAEITDNVTYTVTDENLLVWNGVTEGATFILEIDDELITCPSNSFDLSTLGYKIDSANLIILKTGYQPKKINMELDYSLRLARPIIDVGQGFSSSRPYVLSFTGVDNAMGYHIYLVDKNGNESRIARVFTSTTVDLEPYVIKQGEYSNYNVRIEAVAYPYSGYVNSALTDDDLSISHNRILETPEFYRTSGNVISPIDIRTENDVTKYYLRFYGVEYAYSYEVLINYNTLSVLSNGMTSLYEIDVSDYFTSANSYTISVRALPDPASTNILPSATNSTNYTLRRQLGEVTNIRVSENDSKYTLSFDIQENADAYRVRIVKLNDSNYEDNLYNDYGLINVFEVVSSVDITNYVQYAGEYHIYITALASDSSFYVDSNESTTYGVVDKLETLPVPTNIQFASASKDSFLVRWTGDENADYYIVRVSDTLDRSYEFKVYDATQVNINSSITVEGNYKVSVKAMIDPVSENAATYISSPFSQASDLIYRFVDEHDFERYSVYMYGEYYDFHIDDALDLTNILWYHYLFGIDSTTNLNIYIHQNTDETLKDAIIRLAEEASAEDIYLFTEDDEWNALIGETGGATEGALLEYVARVLLGEYPELAVLENFTLTHTENSPIFSIYYENALDGVKTDMPESMTSIAVDYGNDYQYLSKHLRRDSNSSFAIDSYMELDVSTTEQLLMAVQYGRKPNFVGDSSVAQTVYENAREVLLSIVNNNMSELEKTTAIFDWLMYAFNLNYGAKNSLIDGEISIGDISDWGTRADFYLEGIFLGLNDNDNGGFDGEFYLGDRTATDESFAKAFTLLCAIEGITTRKVNGTITYPTNADGTASETMDHAWNKVLLNTQSEGGDAVWYALDITYSDNRFVSYSSSLCYNMSSHLYYLVTDQYLQDKLGVRESIVIDLPSAVTRYDYYANSNFSLSASEIDEIMNSAIGSDFSSFVYLKEYESGYTDRYQTYDGVASGYNQLQAFVMNAVMYAKYQQSTNELNAGRASFEFRLDSNSMGGSTLPENSTIQEIVSTINSDYLNSNSDRISVQVIHSYDSATDMTTYIFIVAPYNQLSE